MKKFQYFLIFVNQCRQRVRVVEKERQHALKILFNRLQVPSIHQIIRMYM